MLGCREVVDLLATEEWRAAPLGRRLALGLHLAMCRHCRAYRRALHRLGDAARRLYRATVVDPRSLERVIGAMRAAAGRGGL
jgi:hypothetical protein